MIVQLNPTDILSADMTTAVRDIRRGDELIWAASQGDVRTVRQLIADGVHTDAVNDDDRTALHLAAAENHLDVLWLLIQHHADVNPIDRWGGTPLDDACRHEHYAAARILEQHDAIGCRAPLLKCVDKHWSATHNACPASETSRITELIRAASQGDLPTIRGLSTLGVDLEQHDYDRRTPLHLAAAEGHHDIVQYLIDEGVFLSPRDRWQSTPRCDAIRHGNLKIVDLLESHGACN